MSRPTIGDETGAFFQKYGIKPGDKIRVDASGRAHAGIAMAPQRHIDGFLVLKLSSGYNIGINTRNITKVEIDAAEPAPAARAKSLTPRLAGLPKISLLATGGTISSNIDYRTGAVSPTLTADELLQNIPEIAQMADIKSEVLFSEYSENITPQHWMEVARAVKRHAKDYSGIAITHGTDTMHYTSAYLSFALAGLETPVVLVGSQRSSDRSSSDAAENLVGAVKFLTECKTGGIYVAMQDGDGNTACHLGTRVRKNHTSKRAAFETINGPPAFQISDGMLVCNHRDSYFCRPKPECRIGLDPAVGLIKYHPGLDPGMIDHMVKSRYRAIIFEGTGLGHVGRTIYDSVKRARHAGLFLGMTSQCVHGRVRMTVYESGRDLTAMGIQPLDMTAETALVKAMWAAGQTSDGAELEKLMLEPIASEFFTRPVHPLPGAPTE